MLVKKKTYEQLVEELKNLITEAEFAARWTLIQAYHTVGFAISEFEKGEKTKLLQGLAVDIGKPERLLWYCLAFYEMDPKLKKISKEESWNSIVKNRLTTPSDPVEHEHEPITITICKICRKEL